MKNESYVNGLLDRLIELDKASNITYYEMGRILHSFIQQKLYDIAGYESFAHMVEEELSFSAGTARSYAVVYSNFKRLKYNKAEALKALDTHGLTKLKKVLPKMSNHLGERALRNRVEALDEHQINFSLTTEELQEAYDVLRTLGATATEEGRLQHSSEAFMAMVRRVARLERYEQAA